MKDNNSAAVYPFSLCILFVFDVDTTVGGNVVEIALLVGVLVSSVYFSSALVKAVLENFLKVGTNRVTKGRRLGRSSTC